MNESESQYQVSVDQLRQEPLIQFLFGSRFRAATWLYNTQRPLATELCSGIAKLAVRFPASITAVSDGVYQDFCLLVRNAEELKSIVQKLAWSNSQEPGSDSNSERLPPQDDITSICEMMRDQARSAAARSVADDAELGWKQLASFSSRTLYIYNNTRHRVRRDMAHHLMGEIGLLLGDIGGWPSCVKRSMDWLSALLDEPTSPSDTDQSPSPNQYTRQQATSIQDSLEHLTAIARQVLAKQEIVQKTVESGVEEVREKHEDVVDTLLEERQKRTQMIIATGLQISKVPQKVQALLGIWAANSGITMEDAGAKLNPQRSKSWVCKIWNKYLPALPWQSSIPVETIPYNEGWRKTNEPVH